MAFDVEKFTRFSTTTDDMNQAMVFVMECLDKVPKNPSVEMHACYDLDENEFQHYHVAVFSSENPLPAHPGATQ